MTTNSVELFKLENTKEIVLKYGNKIKENIFNYKYFYAPTKEYQDRCHPDLCGFIATNNEIDEIGKLKSGYKFTLTTKKVNYDIYNGVSVNKENYINISKEIFLTEIQKIGFLLTPKIGDIVTDLSCNRLSHRGQVINIFLDNIREEVQIENCNGEILRVNIEYLALTKGIDLFMYKRRGNSKNKEIEIQDVTVERQLLAIKKELYGII